MQKLVGIKLKKHSNKKKTYKCIKKIVKLNKFPLNYLNSIFK